MVSRYILSWVRCLIGVAVFLVGLSGQITHAATLGQTVTNIASVSYELPGGKPVTVLTNPASFIIEAARTQSTVEFFRYAPNAPESLSVQLEGADYAPNGAIIGPFVPMPAPERTAGVLLKPEAPVPLMPATTYFSGELMFLRVSDAGQNGDRDRIETLVAVIETQDGDMVTLRLYESGVNTGEFWAWIPSSRDPTPVYDPVLTTISGTVLTATYVDSFDATEVSVDTALVDPYGRLFNSVTGEYVDNARVTLIDAQTGQPAEIFGIDGTSRYPNSVMSGQDITDESGLVYDIRPGEFRFPFLPSGEYFIQVEPPPSYSFASAGTEPDFVDLPNAPFVIGNEASYGRSFMLDSSGPLNFDIPLDAKTDFVLIKKTDIRFADNGDFIPYTVTVENQGQASSTVVVIDTLPRGFRYVRGTAKLNRQTTQDPDIAQKGRQMTFRAGILAMGETLTLNYVLHVGAGAGLGEATNTIVARDGNGSDISNIARATITLREDLLRSTSTLVGRVAEQACKGDEKWARQIHEGTGVAGVRLYMETGAYAITDQNGLYNFGGLKPGTHIVQVDKETLPAGYEIMRCEENSRYAGSAFSQFVEIKGGGLWRANFYLKRNGDALAQKQETVFNDRTEYKNFDAGWLDTQTPDTGWVYPDPGRTPSVPSVNIGIKHPPGQTVALMLNGHKVAQKNFEARDSNKTRTVMLSRWRGVDILEGDNSFEAVFKDKTGKTVKTLARNIHYVKIIARASALPDQSLLVADGRTNPVLAVRLEDEAGRPVHAGRIAQIDIAAPYNLLNKSRLEGEQEMVSPNSARADIVAGPDGIARIELEPTLQTGKVTIIVTLDNGRRLELFMYLEPEKRDWIIVGLAEGSAAYNSLKNKSQALSFGAAEDLVTDGRVAFFAKGLIKGNWLLTLAVDTQQRRGTRDGDFNTEIDPNAYYTLYGDRSYSAFEAASRYPVYIKLEKRSFYAMFGDFSTNITEGKLTRYNRHLSGFKSEYLGKTFQAIGYGAQTNQGFAKDEIAAQGTSGPYFLSNAPILANSETITIETRDRVRADVILERRILTRHLDYTLDNLTGQIIFRLPVDVSDSAFNPNVIVVDYETAQDAERNLSYGGRVQKQIMADKVQIGSTFVHEGGNGNGAGAQASMIGAEIIAQVTRGTEFRAEIATSRNKQSAGDDFKTANAYLAEINHTSKKLTANVYIRSEQAGFGLRQRSTSTIDVRRYGASASYLISQFENDKTGRRGNRNVTASLYREDNLNTGDSRTLAEMNFSQESDSLSGSVGLRAVQDDLGAGNERRSILAVIRARHVLPKHGATFQITREQPLGGKGNVDDFPQRTRLSVEKTLTKKARIQISHDILGGERNSGQNTTLAVSYAPWAGTEIQAGSDMITSDSGRRIGATIGLDQQFQINEKWSASLGLSNRRVLADTNTAPNPVANPVANPVPNPITSPVIGPLTQIAPDAAISGFETNQNFTAAYLGLGYRTGKTSISSRLETRKSTNSRDFNASFAAAREMSETLSFAGAVRANFRNQDDGTPVVSNVTIPTSGKSSRIDGRLGAAWRPKNNDTVFLNRLDIVHENSLSGAKTTKLVNNFTANKMISERWQVTGNYGVKYVKSVLDDNKFSGFSHLLGVETRFDVTKKIDIGLHGSILIDQGTKTASYAYGPSVGLSPVENVWLSLGYNVSGYTDRDFADAEYAQKGVYLKFRFKFDQNSAKGLLKMISPTVDNST